MTPIEMPKPETPFPRDPPAGAKEATMRHCVVVSVTLELAFEGEATNDRAAQERAKEQARELVQGSIPVGRVISAGWQSTSVLPPLARTLPLLGATPTPERP